MFEQNDNEKLENLLTSQKESFKKSLGVIYPWLVNEVRVRPRLNSKMKKAIMHQFQVNDIKRFAELITQDLYEEDKILFEKLDLFEYGNRLSRLEKYIGCRFTYNEFVVNVLLLKESGLNLDTCRILLGHDNYEKLINDMEAKGLDIIYKDSVLHIYDMPILTDYNRDTKYRCIPKNLFVATSDRISSKLYRDEIKVTLQQEVNNLYLIDSFRVVVPDLKPFKFFTIKIS